MAKVIMLCGLVCTGKTTYAEKLRRELDAAVLSVDEITLALFPDGAGEMLDTYVKRAEKLVFRKAVELYETGITSVLDIGLWTRRERDDVREYFGKRGIPYEIHYISVPREEWLRRIEKRNADVKAGECSAYYVDVGLAEKSLGYFEAPQEDENVNTVSGI